MYKVIFDEEAIGFLNKLSKKDKKRIFDKVISTKATPHHYFERLTGRKDYKLRVGDYRIIADINKQQEKIEVTRIGHRKNIYKRL